MRITAIPVPHLRISPQGFTFNAACMRLMRDVEYVQFLHHFEDGMLFAKECSPLDADNTPWRLNCGSQKIYAKHVKWLKFYKFICGEMRWLSGNVYTIPAALQKYDGKRYIFFDLAAAREDSPLWNLRASEIQYITN